MLDPGFAISYVSSMLQTAQSGSRFWWFILIGVPIIFVPQIDRAVEFVLGQILDPATINWINQHPIWVGFLSVFVWTYVILLSKVTDLSKTIKDMRGCEHDTNLVEAINRLSRGSWFGKERTFEETEKRIYELARNDKITVWGKEGRTGTDSLSIATRATVHSKVDPRFFINVALNHLFCEPHLIVYFSEASWGNNTFPEAYFEPRVCIRQVQGFI